MSSRSIVCLLALLAGCRELHDPVAPLPTDEQQESFTIEFLTREGIPMHLAQVRWAPRVEPGDPLGGSSYLTADERGRVEISYYTGRQVELAVERWQDLPLVYSVGSLLLDARHITVVVDARSMELALHDLPDDSPPTEARVYCECRAGDDPNSLGSGRWLELDQYGGAIFLVNPRSNCRIRFEGRNGNASFFWSPPEFEFAAQLVFEYPLVPCSIRFQLGGEPLIGRELRVNLFSELAGQLSSHLNIEAGAAQPHALWAPPGPTSIDVPNYVGGDPIFAWESFARDIRSGEELLIELGEFELNVEVVDSAGQPPGAATLRVRNSPWGSTLVSPLDATGRSTVYLPGGDYLLQVETSDGAESIWMPLEMDSDRSLSLQLIAN